MSSGLSGTCFNAQALAQEYDGRVQVVDNLRISVTLKGAVLDALELAKDKKSAKEIKDYLENQKDLTSIYITPSTLKYLKKGGRITPAAAALGSLLRIKPILSSKGESFEKCGIGLNLAQAKKKMITQMKIDLENKFKELCNANSLVLSIAHTNCPEEALRFKEEVEKEFPNIPVLFNDPLSLSVSCHIGPGAIALAAFPKIIKK